MNIPSAIKFFMLLLTLGTASSALAKSYKVACVRNDTIFTVKMFLGWSNDAKPKEIDLEPGKYQIAWTPNDEDVPKLKVKFDKHPGNSVVSYKSYTLVTHETNEVTCTDIPPTVFIVLPSGYIDMRTLQAK